MCVLKQMPFGDMCFTAPMYSPAFLRQEYNKDGLEIISCSQEKFIELETATVN